VQFRFVLTKLLATFAILLGGMMASGAGWAVAHAVGDAAAAQVFGWLAVSVLILTGLAAAALIATMALWMLEETAPEEPAGPMHPETPSRPATSASTGGMNHGGRGEPRSTTEGT